MEGPHIDCTVCGSSDSSPWLTAGGHSLRRCNNCTHGYVGVMPDEGTLAKLYSDDAPDDDFLGNVFAETAADLFDADSLAGESYYADRLRLVGPLGLPPDAALLDFGCAMGGFLHTLARRGQRRCAGFDLSASLVQKGISRWGLDLHTGSAEEFFKRHQSAFDVICCFFVLEHVSNPRDMLTLLLSGLAPDGTLILAVPNAASLQVRLSGARSPIVDPPHHLQYFTPVSLRQMLESSDLRVRRHGTDFWSGESDLYLNQKGVPLRLARLLRWVMGVPGAPINFLRLGGVVHVVARRTHHRHRHL